MNALTWSSGLKGIVLDLKSMNAKGIESPYIITKVESQAVARSFSEEKNNKAGIAEVWA